MAHLDLIDSANGETAQVALDDLVVVAEFMDRIYPGLVSTGKVERGGDKPFHTVINGENFHVLEALDALMRLLLIIIVSIAGLFSQGGGAAVVATENLV